MPASSLSTYNVVNIVAYVLNVAITYGVGVGGLFGLPSNAVLSLKYQTLVTPIGWAFSIWGIIFTAQAIWSIVPLLSRFQRANPFVEAVGFNYLFVCLAQAGWTLSFSNEIIWLSLVCMVLIFLFLWRIILALQNTEETTLSQYLLWKFPFTIHGGWITAATCVNINLLLVRLNASSDVQYLVAGVSLVALLVIAMITLVKVDLVLPLVIAWAFYGVYSELKNPADLIVQTFDESEIVSARTCGAVFASLIAISTLLRLLWLASRGTKTVPSTAEDAAYERVTSS